MRRALKTIVEAAKAVVAGLVGALLALLGILAAIGAALLSVLPIVLVIGAVTFGVYLIAKG
jgi:hypothetical protein